MWKHEEELPGRLIAVEGLDGSGKSTQVSLLRRWLELDGYKVFFTQWNSSSLVKKATRRGKKQNLLTPTTFSLIHATDFADRYERQILPLLKAGYLVLADRYIYTAFARDAVRGCDRAWLQSLYGFARKPDITFFFDIPLPTALERIMKSRPRLKYHEAGMDLGLSSDPVESFGIFQGLICKEYLRLARQFKFTFVDATGAPELQQHNIRKILAQRIPLAAYRYNSERGVLHYEETFLWEGNSER